MKSWMSMKRVPLQNIPRIHGKWIETQNEWDTWGVQRMVQVWASVKFKVKNNTEKRHVCRRIEGKISIVKNSVGPQS